MKKTTLLFSLLALTASSCGVGESKQVKNGGYSGTNCSRTAK
jgi:hypothetical protein